MRTTTSVRLLLTLVSLALAAALAGCGTQTGPGSASPSGTVPARSLFTATPAGADTDGAPSSQGLATQDAESFSGFLADVVQDVSGYWAAQFAAWHQADPTSPEWQQIRYVMLEGDQTSPSKCGNEVTGQYQQAGDPDAGDVSLNPAFWCSKDRTIYLSVQWVYDRIWSPQAGSDREASDFGTAYAVAHEIGHAVQSQLGIENPPLAVTVAPVELQSDCLAGIWANAKYYQNALDGNDVGEAIVAAQTVGDYDYFGRDHHGDPDQRANAFMVGYDTGQGASCTLDLPGAKLPGAV
jgi:predicted metalloprotease